LVLVITSGLVKRKSFLDALNERLSPPIVKAKEDAVLERFKNSFDNVEFRKGLEISFTFLRGNEVITKADGLELVAIRNKALSNTLLDIYLGKDPVSKGAKESFAAGLARMVLT